MDYVYDIILNLNENYYEYYEWKTSDKLVNIRKIPIYCIKTDDFIKILRNKVQINKIKLPQKNNLFLLTNKIEVIGVLINNKGQIIKKSSLIYEEEEDILKQIKKKNWIKIDYKIIKKLKNENRLDKEKKDYINKTLNKIKNSNNIYIMKYIYYSIFNIEEENINEINSKIETLKRNNREKLYNILQNITKELHI